MYICPYFILYRTEKSIKDVGFASWRVLSTLFLSRCVIDRNLLDFQVLLTDQAVAMFCQMWSFFLIFEDWCISTLSGISYLEYNSTLIVLKNKVENSSMPISNICNNSD